MRSKCARALGGGGSDRQGRAYPHRPHSRMGQIGARSVDVGGQNHGGKDLSRSCQAGKVWGNGISQNVIWYVVRTCCERVGLEHIAPHDLRRTCAKLCHGSGGELEQIQFLLGHASVQTTERYLGCKQNLGSPVNDRFKLRVDVQPQEQHRESVPAHGFNKPAEKPFGQGIECCHRGSEHDQRVYKPSPQSPPERANLVEVSIDHCSHSLRRCSRSGTARSDSEGKANGRRDPAVEGSVGPGTLPDPTS